jgi:DNA end-binding protein Ku
MPVAHIVQCEFGVTGGNMRSIWKGAISFGLVTIPISLFTATRKEELKFRLLRDADLSPVRFKRVAEADGKEVPWEHVVKGYEYKKDEFVVITDEDLERVDIEATQTVDILNFVKQDDVNPLLFYKPYFMEAGKGGDKAYVLLRDALRESGKIGISKVVIKTRQHLAAIKPQEDALMLELMHFPNELLNVSEFKIPSDANIAKAEMKMALQLIESMTTEWNPEEYRDEYHEAVEKMIQTKLETGGKPLPAPKKKAATNVIDLASVLQRSIEEASQKPKTRRAKPPKKGAA